MGWKVYILVGIVGVLLQSDTIRKPGVRFGLGASEFKSGRRYQLGGRAVPPPLPHLPSRLGYA